MSLVIVPVLIMGVILGLLELIFVHSDEQGMGWLNHGLHAIPMMWIFLFISMNLTFVYGLIGWTPSLIHEVLIRGAVGVLAMLKIKGAAAIAGKVGVSFWHIFILGILLIAAPFIWDLVVCNIPSFVNAIPMNGCPAVNATA